jgi:nucleotide-binding universal stress UspA family protein
MAPRSDHADDRGYGSGVRHRRLRRILVALDGSPDGEAVVDLALEWAEDSGAELLGIAVVDEPAIRRPTAVPLGAGHYKTARDNALVANARDRVRAMLDDFTRRCADRGVPGTTTEDVGVPYEQIVAEAERADLVVLPRHTRFRFDTGENDDTLDRVLRQSPRPVVTVPRGQTGRGPVVIAYGGVHSARTLQLFTAYALDAGAEVWVLTVDGDEATAARRAEPAVDFLAVHGVDVHARPVVAGVSVDEVILDFIRGADARLLVMGTYGRHPLGQLFFGSVARTVVQEAKIPIFLYQ